MIRVFRFILFLLIVAPSAAAQAQNRAVAGFNAEISIEGDKFRSDNPDYDAESKYILGQINIPMVSYFGLNVAAYRGNSKQKIHPTNSRDIYVEYDSTNYSVSPFVRDPNIGLIGLTFDQTQNKYFYQDVGIKSREMVVAGYLGSVTLSAIYGQSEYDDNAPDAKYAYIFFIWYPTRNMLLDVSVGLKDAKDTYAIFYEHQPIGSSGLSYRVGSSWNNEEEYASVSLALIYRFAAKKSLIQRYREDLF